MMSVAHLELCVTEMGFFWKRIYPKNWEHEPKVVLLILWEILVIKFF